MGYLGSTASGSASDVESDSSIALVVFVRSSLYMMVSGIVAGVADEVEGFGVEVAVGWLRVGCSTRLVLVACTVAEVEKVVFGKSCLIL